jgi:ribosomal protein S18 acetylase RimI-like enzyme
VKTSLGSTALWVVAGASVPASSVTSTNGSGASVPALSWHRAEPQHRQALSQLVVTDPAKEQYDPHRGKYHPRRWELLVQSHLRGLKVPVAAGEELLLALDDEGVTAAVHFGFDDTQRHFIIWAAARAIRCRGRGYGREAVEVAVEVLTGTKVEQGIDAAVFTFVHPKNYLSKAILDDVGFEYLGMYEDGYEGWIRDL